MGSMFGDGRDWSFHSYGRFLLDVACGLQATGRARLVSTLKDTTQFGGLCLTSHGTSELLNQDWI